MSTDLLVLTASDVERALSSLDAPALLSLMAGVFARLSDASMPARLSVPTAAHTALVMPARAPPHGTAIKVVAVPRDPADGRGLPASTLVLDDATGGVRALVNARALTAVRTAAGSALATQLLLGHGAAPTGILAFGTGAQIRAHLTILLELYPSVSVVRIAPRSLNVRAAALLAALAPAFPAVQFSLAAPGAPRRAEIAQADIIVCATSARTPLMGDEEQYVKPGAHIILVGSYTHGMHEVSGALLVRAGGRVVVDSREACLAEAGELVAAGAHAEDLVEIGELVRLKEDGAWEADEARCADVRAKGDITVWKSVGVAVQDVAIAARVVARAEEMGLGTRVAGYDA